jgi:PAS domain S-box-containing protein
LAFFTLGVALATKAAAFERSPLRDRLLAFATFACVHGVFQWVYRARVFGAEIPLARDSMLALAAISFTPLVFMVLRERGLRTLHALGATFCATLLATALLVLSKPPTGEAVFRWVWCTPIVAATALTFLKGPGFEGLRQLDRRATQRIAWALAAYGATQVLIAPAPFFPANIFNSNTFREIFGAPPVLLRAAIATGVLLTVLSALNRLSLADAAALKARAHDNEMRLRAVLDAEPECVKVLDVEGKVLDMNPAGLAMCGVSRVEDIRGVSVYSMIKPGYHDAYRAALAAGFRGEPSTVSYEIMSADGVNRVLEQRAAPLSVGEGASVERVVAITRDATERAAAEEALRRSTRMLERAQRIASTGCWEWDFLTRKQESLRESEERLGHFVRMANDAIIIADAGDAIMMFSAGAEKMFGYAAHEIIGRRLACLTPPDGARLDAQAAQRAQGQAADFTLVRKNGQPFSARASL